MFSTRHLEGRIRYETDKVVCIDVHLSSTINSSRPFLTQVLLSLVNENYHFLHVTDIDVETRYSSYTFTNENFKNELSTGIASYLNLRKELELDKPKEEQI